MSTQSWIKQIAKSNKLKESVVGMDRLTDDWNQFRTQFKEDAQMRKILKSARNAQQQQNMGEFVSIMQEARHRAQVLVAETKSSVNEKSVSKSQQRAAGIALAAKRGEIPKSELRGASKEMAKMSTKDLEDFASTEHKGLPKKVKKK